VRQGARCECSTEAGVNSGAAGVNSGAAGVKAGAAAPWAINSASFEEWGEVSRSN